MTAAEKCVPGSRFLFFFLFLITSFIWVYKIMAGDVGKNVANNAYRIYHNNAIKT